MAPPNRIHQKIVMNFSAKIHDYIQNNHGSCEVYPTPFAVFLNADDKTYVEPDISAICDSSTLDSPGTKRIDYGIKLFKYRSAGVREYWIVNPMKQTIQTYFFGDVEDSNQYSFDDEISVGIYDDLKICIVDLLK